MVHRKSIIHCSCRNALYPAQAIQWDKCNLTDFSTNFRFEHFPWTRATYGPRAWSWSHWYSHPHRDSPAFLNFFSEFYLVGCLQWQVDPFLPGSNIYTVVTYAGTDQKKPA